MADHFLTKSRVDLSQCVTLNDVPVLDQYADLHQFLTEKGGEDVARLFAEPLISRGNDQAAPTVSWYSDRAGQGVAFTRLDDLSQSDLGAELKRRLEPLAALIDDPEHGPMVSAALYLTGMSDIWSVGGHPVLINWGMLPEGANANAATRLEHYRGTLGRFLPLDAAPPVSETEHSRFAEDRAKQAAAIAAAGATAAAVAPAAQAAPEAVEPVTDEAVATDAAAPPPGREGRGRPPLLAWLPMLLLLLLVGGAVAWLLTPGNRIFARDLAPKTVVDEDALAAARAINRDLERRLADLRRAHEGAVCRADGTLLMPDGMTIEGLLPPDPNDETDVAGRVVPGSKQPVLPPDPKRVVVDGSEQISDTATLLNHIDSRTAMVLSLSKDGMSTGTGFFVGPDLLVTNYHVIEGAADDGIFVTSKAMGGLKTVKVLKRYGPMADVGADFALLRVENANQPAYSLRNSTSSLRLQSVIAAGYPGDVLRSDREFEALRKGNLTAVPELTVTDGTVNTEQTMSETTHTVVHSAPISTGNSGGPLIDMCGRVVGVNTYVLRGPMRNLNFALATTDLLAFLEGTPAEPDVTADDCQPRVARPAPPVPEQTQ